MSTNEKYVTMINNNLSKLRNTESFSDIVVHWYENRDEASWVYIFLKHPHMKHLWEVRGAILFFFMWYGVVFVIFYFVFSKKSVKFPVIFGIIFGMMAETFLFKKMNMMSFFLFPFLYGGMFYCPFKLIQKIKC